MLTNKQIANGLITGALSVEPLTDKQIQLTGIDLTLGNEFTVTSLKEGETFVRPYNFEDSKKVTATKSSGTYMLSPGSFVLAHTKEVVKLDNQHCARLNGKSTLARHGVQVHMTADNIHPGWDGTIVLEITNVGNYPILLEENMPIASISFTKLNEPVDLDKYCSKYQGQQGAQIAK